MFLHICFPPKIRNFETPCNVAKKDLNTDLVLFLINTDTQMLAPNIVSRYTAPSFIQSLITPTYVRPYETHI